MGLPTSTREPTRTGKQKHRLSTREGRIPLLTKRTRLEPSRSRIPHFSLWPLHTEQNQESPAAFTPSFTRPSKRKK